MRIAGLNLFDIYNLLTAQWVYSDYSEKKIKSIRIKNKADDMNFDFFVVRSYHNETT